MLVLQTTLLSRIWTTPFTNCAHSSSLSVVLSLESGTWYGKAWFLTLFNNLQRFKKILYREEVQPLPQHPETM